MSEQARESKAIKEWRMYKEMLRALRRYEVKVLQWKAKIITQGTAAIIEIEE